MAAKKTQTSFKQNSKNWVEFVFVCNYGSNVFQEEYIEHLKEYNETLKNKLVMIKDYEARLLNKELTLAAETVLKEVTNVCDSACEAIDNLFENLTSAMNSLNNVLLWKSEIAQIPQKISCLLNRTSELSLLPISSIADVMSDITNENTDARNGKKCGTAKVAPMVKGHVISTPTIHLNRVNHDYVPRSRMPMASNLSPIIENSPDPLPHSSTNSISKEIQIPLQRIQLRNFVKKCSSQSSCILNDFPKFKFRKGTNFPVRKSLGSSPRKNEFLTLENNMESTNQNNECSNDEEFNQGNNVNTASVNTEEITDIDPLEGPSWLLDCPQRETSNQSSDIPSYHCRFVNNKRSKYNNYSGVMKDTSNRRDEILNGGNDRKSHYQDIEKENLKEFDREDENMKNIKNLGKSFHEEEDFINDSRTSDSSNQSMIKGKMSNKTTPTMGTMRTKEYGLRNVSLDRSRSRLKLSDLKRMDTSLNSSIQDNGTRSVGLQNQDFQNCSVSLKRLSDEELNSKSSTPLRKRTVDSSSLSSRNLSRYFANNSGFDKHELSSNQLKLECSRSIDKENIGRSKRKAALACIEKCSTLAVTPAKERKLNAAIDRRNKLKKKARKELNQ